MAALPQLVRKLARCQRLIARLNRGLPLYGERQIENYQRDANPLRPFRPTLPGSPAQPRPGQPRPGQPRPGQPRGRVTSPSLREGRAKRGDGMTHSAARPGSLFGILYTCDRWLYTFLPIEMCVRKGNKWRSFPHFKLAVERRFLGSNANGCPR